MAKFTESQKKAVRNALELALNEAEKADSKYQSVSITVAPSTGIDISFYPKKGETVRFSNYWHDYAKSFANTFPEDELQEYLEGIETYQEVAEAFDYIKKMCKEAFNE